MSIIAHKYQDLFYLYAFEYFITAGNSDIQDMIIVEINSARNEEHNRIQKCCYLC